MLDPLAPWVGTPGHLGLLPRSPLGLPKAVSVRWPVGLPGCAWACVPLPGPCVRLCAGPTSEPEHLSAWSSTLVRAAVCSAWRSTKSCFPVPSSLKARREKEGRTSKDPKLRFKRTPSKPLLKKKRTPSKKRGSKPNLS